MKLRYINNDGVHLVLSITNISKSNNVDVQITSSIIRSVKQHFRQRRNQYCS